MRYTHIAHEKGPGNEAGYACWLIGASFLAAITVISMGASTVVNSK